MKFNSLTKERRPIVDQREWYDEEIRLIRLNVKKELGLQDLRAALHCRSNDKINKLKKRTKKILI